MNENINLFLISDKKDNLYQDLVEKINSLDIKNINEVKLSDIENRKINLPGIFLLVSSDNFWLEKNISFLRRELDTSLMPVIIFTNELYESRNNTIDAVIDLPISIEKVKNSIEKCYSIMDIVNSYEYISNNLSDGEKRNITLLKYLFSRDKIALKPERRKKYQSEIYYPLASIILNKNPGGEIKSLEDLKNQGLLNSRVSDKILICPQCNCICFNIEKFCPKCSSKEIIDSEVIKHNCDHTGLSEEFKKNNSNILICPKCGLEFDDKNKDYEKYNGFYCNNCGNIFKESTLIFKCMNCEKEFEQNQLKTKNIEEYYITENGITVAEKGSFYRIKKGIKEISHAKEDNLKLMEGFIKRDLFKEILFLENARSLRKKTEYCLALLEMENLDEIASEYNEKYVDDFLREFSVILQSKLRATDISTRINAGNFLILFLDTNMDGANSALRKIRAVANIEFNEIVKIRWKFINIQELSKKDKDYPEYKDIYRKQKLEKLVISKIGVKSVFKYITILYLLFFTFSLAIVGILYLTGFRNNIAEVFKTMYFLDNLGLFFYQYLGKDFTIVVSFILIGFILAPILGFLGALATWITNLFLRISGGIEIRLFTKFDIPPEKKDKRQKDK